MEIARYSSRMGTFTLVSFTMGCYMGLVNYNGLMVLFTKESSITIRYKAMESICLKMEAGIKVKY